MKSHFLVILLACVNISFSIAQDMIITQVVKTNSISCNLVAVDMQTVTYRLPGDSIPKKISTSAVSLMKFGEHEDQIVTSGIVNDTIFCNISAIYNEKISYTLPGEPAPKTIPKSKAIMCHIGQGCTTTLKNVYLGKFRKYHEIFKRINESSMVNNNGNQLQIENIKLNNGVISYDVIQNGLKTSKSIGKDEVKEITFFEYAEQTLNDALRSYVLTTGGELKECSVDNIEAGKLYLTEIDGSEQIKTELATEKACALFFGPAQTTFSSYNSSTSRPVVSQAESLSPKSKTIDIDLCGLFGYNLKLDEAFVANDEEYARAMRSGFGFYAAMNFRTSKAASIGVYYDFMMYHYSGESTYYYVYIDDRRTLNFIGLNIQYNTDNTKTFIYNASIAPGYLFYKCDYEFNYDDYGTSGGKFGLNVTNRLSLMMSSSVGFFLNASLFYTKGQSRTNLGGGIKFLL